MQRSLVSLADSLDKMQLQQIVRLCGVGKKKRQRHASGSPFTTTKSVSSSSSSSFPGCNFGKIGISGFKSVLLNGGGGEVPITIAFHACYGDNGRRSPPPQDYRQTTGNFLLSRGAFFFSRVPRMGFRVGVVAEVVAENRVWAKNPLPLFLEMKNLFLCVPPTLRSHEKKPRN